MIAPLSSSLRAEITLFVWGMPVGNLSSPSSRFRSLGVTDGVTGSQQRRFYVPMDEFRWSSHENTSPCPSGSTKPAGSTWKLASGWGPWALQHGSTPSLMGGHCCDFWSLNWTWLHDFPFSWVICNTTSNRSAQISLQILISLMVPQSESSEINAKDVQVAARYIYNICI